MRDRFFVAGVHAQGDRIAFAADDAHKLRSVLRKRTGDRVEVVDSGGAAYTALLEISQRAVAARLEAPLDRPAVETRLRVTLAQALPKGQKMDFVVEKATELGVRAIVPVRSARVIATETSDAKRERWQRIAKSAAQQSGRTVVPEIGPIVSWDTLLTTFASYDRVYVPWELAPPVPLRDVLARSAHDAESILFVIGPEGGFAADEIARATAAGATVISLGRRILRTETVALVLLSALAYERGDL
jgi:16S rRNA (uracil1498-N3)-methyltransferase